MTASERVTVRITKEQLLLIQDLIDKGKFDTMTEVVVSALDEFLGKYYSPENIQKVTVDLPRGNMVRLEELVRDGDSVSIDDAIRNAVREYTRNRIS
ncbi:MAG: CopG family transcriptional regulator [Candidatus Methanomethylophilaceae archaeon]